MGARARKELCGREAKSAKGLLCLGLFILTPFAGTCCLVLSCCVFLDVVVVTDGVSLISFSACYLHIEICWVCVLVYILSLLKIYQIGEFPSGIHRVLYL